MSPTPLAETSRRDLDRCGTKILQEVNPEADRETRAFADCRFGSGSRLRSRFGAGAGRGGITGIVTDGTGSAIPCVTARLLDAATGDARQSVTDGAGFYSFISLNPGTYTITAVMKGFETVTQASVPVSVDQVSAVNLAMPVGSASETVQVTSSENLGETSSSTVGQLLSATTIDRVPLLTRNVYDLVQLSAGVTPAYGSRNSSSSFAITNISSGRPGMDVSSYTINGAIEGSVYFMVDSSPLGVAENNAGAIIPALEIPEDDVDEFRVEMQNTPASYQSGGAGFISLTTKSGTITLMATRSPTFALMYWPAMITSTNKARSPAARPTRRLTFIGTRRAARPAAPFSVTNSLFLGTTRLRSSSEFTVPTYLPYPPRRSAQGTFPRTALRSITR